MSFSVFVATQNWAHSSQIACHSQPSVKSTSDWAKESAFRVGESDFEFFLTDHQTGGRGRGQNTWTDAAAGTTLLSTWSLQMTAAPQPILAPALGLALFRAVLATWPDLPLSLKAPNDLFCGSKKIAGILLENLHQGNKNRLLLGLGLNVFSKPDLPQAGALCEFLGLERLSELGWTLFLDRLWLEIVSTLRETKSHLSANQREALKFALNRNPHQASSLEDLTPEGSLIYSGGQRLEWHNL